jgi:chemotaxis protein MotB
MAETKPGKVPQPIIIIKKIKKGGHGGHHGGAWKIAYADFVTAMMAFFLLMWLLSYTDPGTRKGIADYFNRPLKSMLSAGPGAAPTTAPKTIKEKQEAAKKAESEKLEELKKKLDSITEHNPKLRAFKNQIKIEITSEGLRIQIVDLKNRPMFAIGSAVLEDYTKVILDSMGTKLNDVDNPISISGHTDALKYAGGDKGYSNWELSSERANAARRELVLGGMDERKVMQVRGLAGSIPLGKDLLDPSNRRISIVILNEETVARLRQDGTVPPAGSTGLPQDQLTPGGTPAADPSLNLGPGAATGRGAALPSAALPQKPAAGAEEKPAHH